MKSESKVLLILRASLTYFFSFFFVALLIFVPAGSLNFWNGWLFMGALFIPMVFILIYLLVKEPDLLIKRLKTKEKEKTQKAYQFLSIIVCFVTFIVPGLDFRFNWSEVPFSFVLISTLLMISGYLMFFIVMKQNTYASRVIEIQDEHKLIETGFYSFIRHPMYLAGILLFGFAPLVLGSFYALIPMVFIPVLLVIRIKNEEKVLINGLKGYDEYMKKVKYRLLPFIW